VLPDLAARFCVHAVDLPGHGHSAAVPVGDFDSAVDLVALSVPDGSVVCGWSLGGLIAQRIATRHRKKVRCLALVSTTPCFVARDGWPHGMQGSTLETFSADLRADREGTLETFVRLNALHGAHGRQAIRAFAKRVAERGAPSEASLDHSLRWLRETDLRGDAGKITAPTLVVHGTRDALTPVGAGRALSGLIPGAQLVEIQDAAHLPFFTHPREFLDAMETLGG
jgi:pimeloyl-[acyl-carrier protein] methyl ester esterase